MYPYHRAHEHPAEQWDYLEFWNPSYTAWEETSPKALAGFLSTSVTVDWNRNGGVDVAPYSAVLRVDRAGVTIEDDCQVLDDHNDFAVIANGLARSKRAVRGW